MTTTPSIERAREALEVLAETGARAINKRTCAEPFNGFRAYIESTAGQGEGVQPVAIIEEATALLDKYYQLCIDARRGDGYHKQRILDSIAALHNLPAAPGEVSAPPAAKPEPDGAAVVEPSTKNNNQDTK